MLSIIETLKTGGEVPPGTLEKLINSGVLPLSFKTALATYEMFIKHYNHLIDIGQKSPTVTAYEHTAEDLSFSTVTVMRHVKYIEYLSNF